MEVKGASKVIVNSLICSLLIFLCGCSETIKYFEFPYHQFAWYQSGKTLRQARKDCDECIYDVRKSPYPSQSLFDQCMELRGYRLEKRDWLIENQIPIQEVAGWNSFGIHNDVAGK